MFEFCAIRFIINTTKNKEIEIVVCEAGQREEDETAYLLKSSANRERLLKAMENAAHERNLITVKLDELQ